MSVAYGMSGFSAAVDGVGSASLVGGGVIVELNSELSSRPSSSSPERS